MKINVSSDVDDDGWHTLQHLHVDYYNEHICFALTDTLDCHFDFLNLPHITQILQCFILLSNTNKRLNQERNMLEWFTGRQNKESRNDEDDCVAKSWSKLYTPQGKAPSTQNLIGIFIRLWKYVNHLINPGKLITILLSRSYLSSSPDNWFIYT